MIARCLIFVLKIKREAEEKTGEENFVSGFERLQGLLQKKFFANLVYFFNKRANICFGSVAREWERKKKDLSILVINLKL